MYFGVCYYPELWPEERWAKDVVLMREAGVNVARLAEFAWAKLEPEEGVYDFAWLDRVIDLLSQKGINVVLGTPTASPPSWLTYKYPSVLPVDENKMVRNAGSRRHYCVNNPIYQDYTRRIVEAMADHYRDTSSVIGWQIDNEFGGHNSARCYCDRCAQKFREWLKDRYQSLNNLNEAWGTAFWGHTYSAWEHVPLPWKTPGRHNPSLLLDFYRFSSDSVVAYQQLQIDILRHIAPHQFITHNMVALLFDQIDYHHLAKTLDFVSLDIYDFPGVTTPALRAFNHDLIRGFKGKNYWVMEQQCGQDSVRPYNPTLPPGEVRLRTYQAIAHGADGIVYFQWRSARSGPEQYEGGMLNHAGEPTRAYYEIKRVGEDLKRLAAILEDTIPSAEVAMLFCYENLWALELPPHNQQLTGMEGVRFYYADYHEVLYDLNVPVAFLQPDMDLSFYRLIIVPSLILVNEDIVKSLYDYVSDGGTLLLTIRSGVKSQNNLVTDKPLPGAFRELLGVHIAEFDSLTPDTANAVMIVHPELQTKEFPVRIWCEVIEPETAQVVAKYVHGYYAGKAAITVHGYGKGQAAYIGTVGTEELYRELLKWLLAKAGVRPIVETPLGVEASIRIGAGKELLFLLNHTPAVQRVELHGRYADAITNLMLGDIIDLEPREVRVLKRLRPHDSRSDKGEAHRSHVA